MSDAQDISTRPELPRTVRGKRPRFHAAPGVDEVMSMVLALTQELSVLADRVDAAERVLARRGIALADEIETLDLDEAALREREARRGKLYDRVLFIFAQQRAQMERRDSDETYASTLEEIARGDI